MESSNNLQALAVVDAQFQVLSDRIDALNLLSDKLQTSRSRLAEIDGEIRQVKNDADSLERAKRVSKLTALNSSREIAQADDSAIVAAIVHAKARVLESGRVARNMISEIYWQLMQARKMNAVLLLEEHFEIRKVPLRLSDLANAAKIVVELRNLEEILTRPQRGQDEELGALFSLKARFEVVRAGVLAEENLALEIKTADEPAAVAESAATNLEPVAA
jgi:hypothetical protein